MIGIENKIDVAGAELSLIPTHIKKDTTHKGINRNMQDNVKNIGSDAGLYIFISKNISDITE